MDISRLENIYIMIIIHIAALLVDMMFTLYVLKNAKKDIVTKYFVILQFAIILLVFSKMIKAVAPTVELRYFSTVIQYITIFAFSYYYLYFAYVYNFRKHMKTLVRILLLIYPISMFVVIITNPSHNLFFAEYTITYLKFGKLFYYVHTPLAYAYILAGITLFFRAAYKNTDISRRRALLHGIAIIFPIVINLLYLTGVITPFFDYTPIAYAFSIMLYGYAIIKYEFLSVQESVVLDVLENNNNGIAISDNNIKIVYKNSKFGFLESKEFTKSYAYDFQNKYKIHTIVDIENYVNENRRLETNLQELENKKNVLLSEIQMKRELLNQKKELNFAKNLHDEIGHIFTIIIHSLEMARSNDDTEKIKSMINEHLISLEDRIAEYDDINKLVAGLQGRYNNNINLTFEYKEKTNYDKKLIHQLYFVIKECITNAIKHAKANEISVQFDSEMIIIKNNGNVNTNFVEGFGLKSIRNRLDYLVCRVEFSSKIDEFYTKIYI